MYGLVMALLTTVVTAIELIVSSSLFGFAPMSPGPGAADILMTLSQNSSLATGIFIAINLIPFCILCWRRDTDECAGSHGPLSWR